MRIESDISFWSKDYGAKGCKLENDCDGRCNHIADKTEIVLLPESPPTVESMPTHLLITILQRLKDM